MRVRAGAGKGAGGDHGHNSAGKDPACDPIRSDPIRHVGSGQHRPWLELDLSIVWVWIWIRIRSCRQCRSGSRSRSAPAGGVEPLKRAGGICAGFCAGAPAAAASAVGGFPFASA